MRTKRQIHGASAEDEAAAYLTGLGWQIVARNLRLGHDEIDVLAVDPGPPRQVVGVEVRSLRTSAFGAPEERVDRAKVAHMYRALAAVGAGHGLPIELFRLPRRVDLVIVDRRSRRRAIRHMRAVEMP